MATVRKRRERRVPEALPDEAPRRPPRGRIVVALLALILGSGIWIARNIKENDSTPDFRSAPAESPKETPPPVSEKVGKPDTPPPPKTAEMKMEREEEKIGPFIVHDRELTVLLSYKKSSRDGVENDRTVEGFEVRDERNRLYHQESFGTPGLRGESGSFEAKIGVKVFKIEGKNGEGLIFYYDIRANDLPAAAFQVFGLQDEQLAPLSAVIGVDGAIDPAPNGGSENTLRLLPGDLIQVHQRTGPLLLRIPFAVDFQKSNLRLVQSSGLFDFEPPGQSPPEPGKLQFFSGVEPGAKEETVDLKGTEEIKLTGAYAEVRVKDDPVWNRPLEVSNLWLMVAIGKKEGWVTGKENGARLGLQGRG